jgi:SAM-dependent methyltransferase
MAQAAHPSLQGTVLPEYTPPLHTNGRATAPSKVRFPDGESVAVSAGRARWYPHVVTSAPCMLAVYEAVALALTDERLVWDVGCGSGAGTRVLASRGHRVVGLDSAPEAILYAKKYAPEQTFEVFHSSETDSDASAEKPDLILLVDVLSVAEDPRALLSALRKRAGANTSLLVVELQAHASQTLMPPARRAHSLGQLEVLLFQSGWSAKQPIQLGPWLVASRAEPHLETNGAEYDAASRAIELGDLDSSRAHLAELHSRCSSLHERSMLSLDIADLSFGLGDGDGACAAVTRAGEEDPSQPGTQAGMSRLSLAMGQANDALLWAVQAFERDPLDPRSAIALAEAAEALGSPESNAAWAMAAALMPDDRNVLTQRARCAADSGQGALAIAALEQLRTYHPAPDASLALTLGWLLLQAGRAADAALEARLAAAIGANEADVKDLLAALHSTAA